MKLLGEATLQASYEASMSATFYHFTYRGHDAGNMQSLYCQHLSA